MPLGILAPVRLTELMRQLTDARAVDPELRWLPRTRITPVSGPELIAKYFAVTKIADIVADDARALTYKHAQLELEASNLANVKQGIHMTQDEINELSSMPAVPGDPGLFRGWQIKNAEALIDGIRQRQNWMIVRMLLDSMVYRRGGIIFALTFGMPSNLKMIVDPYWNDHANATPVADVNSYLYRASIIYGGSSSPQSYLFNTMTMSRSMYDEMVQCQEFIDRAKFYLAPGMDWTNVPYADQDFTLPIAQKLLKCRIEFDDTGFYDQTPEGTWYRERYHPINEILFTNSADHNRGGTAWDMGNAVVTESIVNQFVDGGVVGGRLPANARGPIGYNTVTPGLNPPNMQQWGVARCFPRKGRETASGKMVTLPPEYSDLIPVTLPFN